MRTTVLLLTATLASAPLGAAALPVSAEVPSIASLAVPDTKLTLVNVWATWCVPCVREMPDLRALDEAFDDSDLTIVGINLDDTVAETVDAGQTRVRTFLDRHRIAFRNVYYTGNIATLAETLGFDGEIPVTLLLDRNGKVLYRHSGRIDRAELESKLMTILDQGDQE